MQSLGELWVGAACRVGICLERHGRCAKPSGISPNCVMMELTYHSEQPTHAYRAPNSTHCEWSACGRYILTATLSPRLRVDNGVKIYWCGGQLLHIHPVDSLYQAILRPRGITNTPPFPAVIPAPPEANESVVRYRPKGEESNGGESRCLFPSPLNLV